MVMLLASCGGEKPVAGTLPFLDDVPRPSGEALFALESEGVTVELFAHGECATIIETVPGYGILLDEFCPEVLEPPFSRSFDTPNCPVTDFGDECGHWLPQFTVGRTVDAAAFVCVEEGRVEVRRGWWMADYGGVGAEVFPLTADGVRLDSVSNEFDDRMRERCEATDPVEDSQ